MNAFAQDLEQGQHAVFVIVIFQLLASLLQTAGVEGLTPADCWCGGPILASGPPDSLLHSHGSLMAQRLWETFLVVSLSSSPEGVTLCLNNWYLHQHWV